MRFKLRSIFREWRVALVTATGTTGLVIGVSLTGIFQNPEWDVLDLFFRWHPLEATDSRIVIVEINESDINQLGQWPMSDQKLAQFLEKIKAQNPRGIGLDLFRDLPVEPGHDELVQVFESTPNLIGIEKALGNPVSAPSALVNKNQVGIADLVVDRDGKIRRSLISIVQDQQTKLSLGTQLGLIYLAAENVHLENIKAGEQYGLGKAVFNRFTKNDGGYVNADDNGYQIFLNFRGASCVHTPRTCPFERVSMTEVLEDRIPPELMKDRLVLIGITAESLPDFFYTPYPKEMPGVEIHGHVASQFLSAALDGRHLINTWSDSREWLWLLGWTGSSTILGTLWFRQRGIATIGIVVLGASLVFTAYQFFLAGWWIPVIMPLIGVSVSAIISVTYLLTRNLRLSYRQLEDYARNLEEKVTERTQELAQKKDQLQIEIKESHRKEMEIRLLLASTQAINRTEDLDAGLSNLLRFICQTFRWDLGEAWILNETGTALICSHGFYLGDRSLLKFRQHNLALSVAPGKGLLGRIWLCGQSECIQNIATQEQGEFFCSRLAIEMGIQGILGIPILSQNRNILNILVFYSKQKMTCETRVVDLIQGITTQVAAIIQRRQVQNELKAQKEKTDELLLNILPSSIADRLKKEESRIADHFEEVTVLFTDLVGFTEFSSRVSSVELVRLLNLLFSKFDTLCELHGLEKIKTIGDAYMAVAGLPKISPDHAQSVANMALAMLIELKKFNQETRQDFRLRIGINTGAVVAGVIGTKKFIYDLWGDTVNVASRMESSGEAGKIQVSATTYEHLKAKYLLQERGKVKVKGKGEMLTYWLVDHI